jgi:predicted ATPase/DNA-binding CsgD family transcriptional regulator
VGELLAACPEVSALITSRAALHLRWEHELAVPPLDVPDPAHLPPPAALAGIPAVALFLHRAQAVRRDFVLDATNAAAVAEVCARLDGLPLAIELAAARVKVLPPAALLARLERRLGLLVGGGPDRPTRHQTLRGALDWSHDLLDGPQQVLLRRLAAFAGGFTLAAAEVVCVDEADALRQEDVLDALEALVDNSLVRPAPIIAGEPRYGLLETVREYAAERLAARGETNRLERRHAAHFLGLAQEAAGALRGAAQAEWLGHLEREHDNFRAVLSHGLAAGGSDGQAGVAGRPSESGAEGPLDLAEEGLRLAGWLAPFWRIRGYLTEGQRWLELLLEAAAEAPAAVRARALLGIGELAEEQGALERARARLEEGLDVSRQAGDDGLIGRTARVLGQVLLDSGDVAAARPLLEEGVARLRATGGPGDLGDALLALAALAQSGGDLHQTRGLLEEALEVGRQEGDGTVVAAALYDLGRITLFQGERDRGQAYFEEGVGVASTLNSPLLLMKLHRWLGTLATRDGDAAGAERHLQASLNHARESDDRAGIAYALAALGERALWVGDPEAVPLLEESLRRFTELGLPWGRGRALGGLARVAESRGDAPAALAFLREELELWRDLDDGLGVASGLERIARVLARLKQVAAAARLIGAATAERERLGAAGPEGQPLDAILAEHAGDPAWQAAFVAGQALPRSDVVAEALALAGDRMPAVNVPADRSPPAERLPFDLTPREAEVLQLVAEGASDAEIAERLIVSVRTVNRHVANILGKTGASNRTAAAALALRSSLS